MWYVWIEGSKTRILHHIHIEFKLIYIYIYVCMYVYICVYVYAYEKNNVLLSMVNKQQNLSILRFFFFFG